MLPLGIGHFSLLCHKVMLINFLKSTIIIYIIAKLEKKKPSKAELRWEYSLFPECVNHIGDHNTQTNYKTTINYHCCLVILCVTG